jgi:diguanylate cyclase (GGDEF)-like protein
VQPAPKLPRVLLVLDIDHFKNINDTYGHLTGDVVLREVTQRIIKAVRGYDSIGRYGGVGVRDRTPGCTWEQIEYGAERIRFAVDDGPIVANESTVSVTVSIGAAVTTVDRVCHDCIKAKHDDEHAGLRIRALQLRRVWGHQIALAGYLFESWPNSSGNELSRSATAWPSCESTLRGRFCGCLCYRPLSVAGNAPISSVKVTIGVVVDEHSVFRILH